MHYRLASLMLALGLTAALVGSALAQADDGTPPSDDAGSGDLSLVAPSAAPPTVAPTLFLTLIAPSETDIIVPSSTSQFTVQGATLPGAVVSIDGDLIDTDDQGAFAGVMPLDDGANEIEVAASDDQGNQITTTIFITRGN